ncbi:MAG: hypothetical protein EOL89_11880, partial [Actinobacteria bacterium]|nr:hypothetical protein [Actinomycetota bacterium]
PFRDVKPWDQFYKEITWLAAEGVSTGWPDGTFRPGKDVARDAMAAFLFRFDTAFPRTVDIASITDFHGQLVATDDSGGILGVSGVLETLRAASPRTLFVANGDSVGGSAYESAILDDEPTLELLNAMGLAVSTAGNHEFDRGWADFRDRIMLLSDFNYLGANVNGTPELKDFEVHRVGGPGGVAVGIVGTLTPGLRSLVSVSGIPGITVDPVCEATNTYADRLKDGVAENGEADVVIAMSHYGHADIVSCDFSANVDAVLSGHSHDKTVTTAMRTDGVEIPLVEGENAGGTVSHLRMTHDRTSDGVTPDVVENIETESGDFTTLYSADVKAIYDAAIAASFEAGKAIVGAVSDDLLLPGNVNGNRGAESTIGTFLANVALWHGDTIADVDFGVINPGGIRASFIYAGDTSTNPLNVDGAISYAEAFTVQPFGNTMAYIDLTGQQVDLLLEQQFYARGSRPMLKLGLSDNVRYVFDANAPAGARVSDIFIDGVRVDPTATYTVSGNQFLLTGGDDFLVFVDGTNLVDTGIIDLQVLIDHFRTEGTVDPVLAQGSTGLTLSGDLVPGTDVTASIYSLAFTNGEITPSAVELYVDGVLVGTGAVTIDPVLNNDVTGSASITFTVPAGASADSELRIATDDGTTDITF